MASSPRRAAMGRRIIIFCIFVLISPVRSPGESSTCLTLYKQGGAPAVFRSPKCPRWKLSDHDSRSRAVACQSAMHRGRRKSQEDRTLCALDVRIPFFGAVGLGEVTVGILAVFDGHNGAEASEMASKLLLEYFILHTYFLLDATYSVLLKRSIPWLPSNVEEDVVHEILSWGKELDQRGPNMARFPFILSGPSDGSFHLEILKESLLRAIHDIDVTFSKEASRSNIYSGSTASVVLIADGHILVANVGDSKALVCSETFQSPTEAKATLLRLYIEGRHNGAISPAKRLKLKASNGLAHFSVKELSSDHHPDREDERYRVESAGGYVLEWGGVSRVNGQLAVSRAIGDVPFKSYGVTSTPEVTNWQTLSTNDSYLVVASDGIFEKMSPQGLCDLLWELHNGETIRSPACSNSMADCIVETAFQKGSMDNMAAVVVPLGSSDSSQMFLKKRCGIEGDVNCLTMAPHKLIYEHTVSNTTINGMQMEHGHPTVTKLDRFLVQGTHGDFRCFYLYENLDENMDATFQIQTNDQHDLVQGLPVDDHHYDGLINLYRDRNLCFHFGMTADGASDQCSNSEGFANFLSLLKSIPFEHGLNYQAFDNGIPDLRYILRKKFARGAFGEVWLAFCWNCSQGYNASEWSKDKIFHLNVNHLNNCDKSQRNTSSRKCQDVAPDDNFFILKRIMVEKGAATYLSGLREKYFGEYFLNASAFLGSSMSIGVEASANGYLEGTDQISDEQGWHVHEEGLDHIARYVESFESYKDTWLVFHYEGVSLSKLLYTAEDIGAVKSGDGLKHTLIFHPSKWWLWLKTTEAGQEEMRHLIWQLLKALKSCHDRNITHRDIKPENMVICFEDMDTGRCLKGSPSGDKKYKTKMRIIDFGSAIDKFTMKHLYGSIGPSRDEQTDEYTPPEALLNSHWYQGPTSIVSKYDTWSVGVVMLELILGTPNVFQVDARTRTLLDRHVEDWNHDLKELAYKLRSFMEMCILVLGSSSKHQRPGGTNDFSGAPPASWKCSEEFFSFQVKNRDPLQLGFPNVLALRLVRQLLLWDPEDRLSVDDALRHPYFHQPLQS